jgi:V8-like Glu-specific endopeptidase
MPIDRKLELMRDRAVRALGDHRVEQAVAKVRAIIGPQNIPASEPLAQAALDKLHRGEVPMADELAALEIVVRLLRPVVFSHDGVLDDLPDRADQNLQPQEFKDLWSTFRTSVQPLVGSIGRIETKSGTHVGTGFLVAGKALATNRHVLGALTFGSELLAPGAARVVFRQEDNRTNKPGDTVPIDGTLAVHPKLDIVLLAVAHQDRPVLEIDESAINDGDKVAAIGYPGEDPINNPLFLSGVFKGKFGVKRAAVGEVLDGTESPLLFHDCSTTQGNSGSPVFSLKSGRVAAIHRAGFFMYRNEAVDGASLREFVADNRT